MAWSALLVAAFAAFVFLLPALVVEAKFSFGGFGSSNLLSSKKRNARVLAATTPPFNPCAKQGAHGHHGIKHPCSRGRILFASSGPAKDPNSVPPPPSGGNHPPGVGHHPPGSGHHGPGQGQHHSPNAFGVLPGHHPPGVGHHPPGVGHHPGKGHHCNVVPGLCLTSYFATMNETTCCSKSCVDLQTDTEHCGSCPNICAVGDLCCSGSCKDVTTDPDNCGSCGHVCPAPGICQSGLCSYAHAPAPAPAT